MENAEILLVYPPSQKVDFMMGIPCLAEQLHEDHIEFDVLDAPALGYSVEQILEYIEKTTPKRVGVSIPFTQLADSAVELMKAIRGKFPSTLVVAGGAHTTLCPDEIVPYANVLVLGDGETAIVHIIKEGIKSGKLRMPVDRVVKPRWESVEFQKYHMRLIGGHRAMPIISGRGCVFNCNFCSNRKLSDGKVRYRDTGSVIEEIRYYKEYYGFTSFSFTDETFFLNRQRAVNLCSALIESRLNIRWWAQTRANTIDKQILKLAKKAGCYGLSIGVETGNSVILEKINKGISLVDAKGAVKLIRDARILSYAGFIVAHPWDTEETVIETLNFADELDPDFIGVAIATPFPETQLRRDAVANGVIIAANWSEYDPQNVTYIPNGLKGIDIKRSQQLLFDCFYAKRPKRIYRKWQVFLSTRDSWRVSSYWLLALFLKSSLAQYVETRLVGMPKSLPKGN